MPHPAHGRVPGTARTQQQSYLNRLLTFFFELRDLFDPLDFLDFFGALTLRRLPQSCCSRFLSTGHGNGVTPLRKG